MESIILFYDNALIYSPNVFFIFLALLLSFIILLIGDIFILFVKSIRYTAEYITEIQKKRKKTKHNRIRLLIKTVSIVYMIINKKKERIILNSLKIVNAIKKEVLIKEGE